MKTNRARWIAWVALGAILAGGALLAQTTGPLTGGVNPSTGTTNDTFTFTGRLTLPVNPLVSAGVQVFVADSTAQPVPGAPFQMTPADGSDANYVDGRDFQAQTTLPVGQLSYQFSSLNNLREEQVPFGAAELGRAERSVCWSPDGSRIAFESTQAGNDEIYVSGRDGTGVVRLTNNTAADQHPAWSPDGAKIAYASTFGGGDTADIWVMSAADGSGAARLTNDPGDDVRPSWSPDGSKVAFLSTRAGGGFSVFVMNSDGSNQALLAPNALPDGAPRWSPDGSGIAFASDRDGNPEIYLWDLGASTAIRMTNSPAEDLLPSWAPDGKSLCWQSDGGGTPGVWVMSKRLPVPQRMSLPGKDAFGPAWSPDGKSIAFSSSRLGSETLFLMETFLAESPVYTGLQVNPPGGVPASLEVTASPLSQPGGGNPLPVAITVTVRDTGGAPVANALVTFQATSGTLLPGQTTNAQGQVATSFLPPTDYVGKVTITIVCGTLTHTLEITLEEPNIPKKIGATVAPAVLPADGASKAVVTATITDNLDRTVPDGTPVAFSTNLGQVDATAQTSAGKAVANYTAPATGGAATITIAAGKVTTTVTVRVVEPRALTLSADPGTVVADGQATSTVRAVVTDEAGARVPDGIPVKFSTDAGTVSPGGATVNGEVVGTFTAAATAGTAHVTAAAGVAGNVTATVDIQMREPNVPRNVALTANPTSLPADGVSTATFTATITDGAGLTVPDGTEVRFAASAGVVGEKANTANGVASVSYTAGTQVGTVTITVSAGAVSRTFDFPLVEPNLPRKISLSANLGSLPADGLSTATFTAAITDALDRTVPDGTEVRFVADAGGITQQAPTAAGRAVATYTAGTEARAVKITVTSGPVSQVFDYLLVEPNTPQKVTLAADPPSLPADGASTTQVTITVVDRIDRPVPDGTPVQMGTTAGTLSAPAGVTTNGRLTVTLTAGTDPATARVTATAGGITQSLDVVLTDATTVEVGVTLPAGATMPPGSQAELRDSSDALVGAAVSIGTDGRFRLSAPPGVYDLVVAAPGFVPLRTPGVDMARRARAPLQQLNLSLLPQPDFGAGARMVTVPFRFRDGGVEKVLGDQNAVLFSYQVDAATGQGSYRLSGSAGFPGAEPGRGFWLKQRRGYPQSRYEIAAPAEVVPESGPVVVPLAKGWQMVGSPFASGDLAVAQVKVVPPGSAQGYPLGDPGAVAAARSYLWGLKEDGSGYELISATVPGSLQTVKAYRAYWIRTLVDGAALSFDPPSRVAPSPPTPLPPRGEGGTGWQARLAVRSGERSDTTALFGVGAAGYAVEGPPAAAGDALSVRFLAPDGSRAAVDVRANAGSHSWRFEVSGGRAGEEVDLTWPDLGRLPRSVRLVLVDEETGRRRQMRTSGGLRFTAGEAPRRFRVEAEPGGAPLVAITGLGLSATRGSARLVQFQLSAGASVSVSLLSPGGRTLRRIAEGVAAEPGRQAIPWDGRDARGVTLPGGIALLEVTATTEEGATVRAVQPVVLTR